MIVVTQKFPKNTWKAHVDGYYPVQYPDEPPKYWPDRASPTEAAAVGEALRVVCLMCLSQHADVSILSELQAGVTIKRLEKGEVRK